ncbi:MAG: antifreeze protein [Magnetospirillum sp.]|nr:antifreeze protein [Magnetospirillum sp.]
MTDCRARRGSAQARRLAAGLVAVAVLGSAAAQAQAPLSTYDPETMELAEPAAPGRDAKVVVNELKAPSAESVGVLDQAHGGFAANLWAGTPAAVARKLIPLLPAAPASQVVRSLERRLLLTAAAAPDGAVEGDRPSLVELRAERLSAMGDSDGVVQLAAVAPQAVEGPVMQRVKLDALLLSGDTQGACADQPRDGSQPKLAVLCNFLVGKTLEGNLGLDLLRERKDADHAFVVAAETLSGLPPVPADKVRLDEVTPLHLATFAAAKMPLPADAVGKAPPAVAKAVAMSFSTPFEVRLAAGERAEAAGVLPPESLRKLYLEATFAPDEMGAPLAKAETVGGRGRALLFRAATDQPDPVIRAHFIAKAQELAAARGQTTSTARVFALLLADAKPDPALVTVAPALARANLALGRAEAAQWLELAKTDPAAAKAVERLWPLNAVAAAAPGQPVGTVGLAAWRTSLEGLPPEVAARRAAVVLGSLSALGAKVPDAAWLDTLALPAGGIKPGLFALLQSAALEARLGTTLLAALAGLGDQPLDKVDVISLTEAISARSRWWVWAATPASWPSRPCWPTECSLGHGWTRIDTDKPFSSAFIRVHLCH